MTTSCCDNVNVTVGNTIVMFGSHKYEVVITYCKSCGSKKATSSIKHLKKHEDVYYTPGSDPQV